MKKSEPAPSAPESLLLVREDTAPKLSRFAAGGIKYQVLVDPKRKHVYLRLTGNDGGGLFSREAVPLESVRACLNGRDPAESLRATAFTTAFTGRSSNNRSFLCAALLHEALLTRAPEKAHDLVDALAWDKWAKAVRAVEGDLPVVQLVSAVPPADATEPATLTADAAPLSTPEPEPVLPAADFAQAKKGRKKVAAGAGDAAVR